MQQLEMYLYWTTYSLLENLLKRIQPRPYSYRNRVSKNIEKKIELPLFYTFCDFLELVEEDIL